MAAKKSSDDPTPQPHASVIAPAEFEPGELDALLADGEASGEPLDAEGVFAELRGLGSPESKNAE